MKKTLLLLALILWTGMQAVMAQTATVSGTVLDENGQPMPAVSVKVKGSQSGTTTDVNGVFKVTIPEGAEPELVFDVLGYAQKTVSVTDVSTPLTVTMEVSNKIMDEVLVVGYQETTKQKYVGAADKISADEIEKFPVSDITKAIEGAAPGIQIAGGTGEPGTGAAIRIRGIGSVSASSSPLIVLDGAPYVGDITSINPADIQSLTVLKDATATSLYGSRGANGVIMITTKHGKRGGEKPQLRVDGKVGIVRRALPNYDVITNEKDYYEIAWEAYRNSLLISYGYYEPGKTEAEKQGIWEHCSEIASGLHQIEGPGIVAALGGYNSYDVADNALIDPVTGKLNPNATLKYHDNWEDELSRTGIRQDYNVSLSGGSEKTDYYFSVGYMKEEGFVKYTNYDRFTSRLNLNSTVTDWLKTGINVSASLSTQNYSGSSTESGDMTPGYNPFYVSRTFAPIYPVYFYDSNGHREIDPRTGEYKYDWGDKNGTPESSIGTRATAPNANVLGALALDQNRRRVVNVVAIPYLEATFMKYFKFKTMLSANLYNSYSTAYNNMYYGQFADQGGSSYKTSGNLVAYTWNQLLTYNRNFGLHHVDAILGHENYSRNYNGLSAGRAGLAFPGNTNLAGAATPLGSSSYEDNHRIESYFAIANYNYAAKYYFSASIRKDGSSRLAPETRWGKAPFWSLGASWMLSEEDFLQDVDWLDVLKVKLSYGTAGNEALLTTSGSQAYYAWQALYSINYPNGNNSGAIISNIGGDQLTWETSKQLNAGFQISTFKNRLNAEFNYFIRTSADLLYNLPMPLSTGIPTRPMNTLTMQNRGVELTINADAVRTSDFTWNINFNATHFKNIITEMPEGHDSILRGNYMWKKGHSRYDFYLVESHVNPETGYEEYSYIDADGNKADTTLFSYAQTHGGRDYRGSSLPDLMGAITNSFTYKGFDLSFMFTFGLGGQYYDRIYQNLMGPGTFGRNWSTDILDRWTPENKNTDVPKVENDNVEIAQTSTRFLIDASYLSLRNVSLGYTFTGDWVKNFGLRSLRIYGVADNLMMLSKRKGMNPQATYSGNPSYTYLPAQTYMVGLTVGL